ncbi:hypothetical protein LTR10_000819 [Elasticomyces elasticus]|nr:hypothetical protein LTR10_000819 [Elasticomyces elasticus]KAK4979935.1 hypothetical protein LTR42_000242 [Elasticomyces elasticus]
MADHLAATYLDRAHDAERTTLQLKVELHAACTKVEEWKETAATESFKIEGIGLRSASIQHSQAKLVVENAELKEKLHRVEAEKEAVTDMYDELRQNFHGVEVGRVKLEAENAELKKKLHRVEAERGATVDMYDELRAKVEELESAARDREAESHAEMPNHQWGSARRGAWCTC